MGVIQVPMQIPELEVKPDPVGGVELSANMQQVLSLLTGFWKNKRVVLKASPTGTLFVASRPVQTVMNVVGVGANYTWDGPKKPCSEVLIMAHPDNTGRIWVNAHAAAAADTGYPLDAGDGISWGMINLSMLHALIVTDANKLILVVTE